MLVAQPYSPASQSSTSSASSRSMKKRDNDSDDDGDDDHQSFNDDDINYSQSKKSSSSIEIHSYDSILEFIRSYIAVNPNDKIWVSYLILLLGPFFLLRSQSMLDRVNGEKIEGIIKIVYRIGEGFFKNF